MKTTDLSAGVWIGLLAAGGLAGCSSEELPGHESVAKTSDRLGLPGGAQACVVGTTSLRIAQRVTTSGGLAANGLSMESGSVANGGANINNVGGAQVRISGATINGTVLIAGPGAHAAERAAHQRRGHQRPDYHGNWPSGRAADTERHVGHDARHRER